MKKTINKPLIIILLTVLLDVIWLWIVIPVLPYIVQWYWFSEFYVWAIYAIFALGMFFWWLIFWKLSDKYWRNRVLELTVWLNVIWYLAFAISPNLYIFALARFIWWLWASGFAVWQAYIADISSDEDRIKNMWLIWAMFWIWFMFWPVIWWLLSSFSSNLNFIWYAAGFVSFLNLLSVIFLLPKVKMKKASIIEEYKFDIKNPLILMLLTISFIVALWFSSMQSTFALVMKDRFLLDASAVWYLFWFIWIIAIIYQGKLINYVRKWLTPPQMLLFGLSFLIVWFLLFSVNNYFWAIFFIIFMFPVWYGTINPTVASMHSKVWAKHVWKLLGINASMISLGNIIGPFLAWALYMHWSWLPYVVSSILFIILLVFVFIKMKDA